MYQRNLYLFSRLLIKFHISYSSVSEVVHIFFKLIIIIFKSKNIYNEKKSI